MEFNVRVKSEQLLQKIANTMHDRGEKNVFFTIAEVHVVEAFLHDFALEAFKQADEY